MIADWALSMATAGGSAVVGAVATDAWAIARAGLVRSFGRTGRRSQELVADLADLTAAELGRADERDRAALARQWAGHWEDRLADLLAEFPDVGEEVGAWIDRVARESPTARPDRVNTFVAGGNAVQHNAPSGSITVNNYGQWSAG